MILENKDIATIVVQEKTDGRLYDFRIKFKKAYKDFNTQNIVLDMSKISRIALKDVMEFQEISDIHKFPSIMSVEDILIQSSNIGAIKIGFT